ncbi:VIT1/CCC1 transporter family protein [Rhodococcoides kroppenstedtii]|uniref:VIT1/CCC1 transporter family protein n=1 Tax=Rhodococcoides kroppenstedtii TaxID=293050 RepID=UPI0028E4F6C2|nr:VIT1/CCC1 transporter family protein [Rhodococcus kroppenstedtii]
MTTAQDSDGSAPIVPHEVDHSHADVSGGWLRAATFGAMDGLVTNTSLIAGVGGAGVTTHTLVLSGVAGLVAGAFSMALGEYTSVTTQNEQIDAEVVTERAAFRKYPDAEEAELVDMLTDMGMTRDTATTAAREIHTDSDRAVDLHISRELGIDPHEKPSPWVAAGSSFVLFSIGAIIPLIPFLLGFASLAAGLACGGVGLLAAGAIAAHFTARSTVLGALRQLILGGLAVAATYAVGSLIGVGVAG